jgi:hypothetical protein
MTWLDGLLHELVMTALRMVAGLFKGFFALLRGV